jgi:hypothetical protein
MSIRRFRGRISSALVTALVLLGPAPRAHAEPEYPHRIRSTLGLNYDPPCSICHQYGKTGDGTPIEPFAWSMRERGLSADDSTFKPALASDETDRVDSDGDGVPDTVELSVGTDPNSIANDCIIPSGTTTNGDQCTPGDQASPNLGCALGAPRPGAALPMSWVVASVSLMLWAARRRRPAAGKILPPARA